jgi:hypothetical protein
LTTDQPAPHLDGRISKRRFTTYDRYVDPRVSHLVYLEYL